ncbi:MAG: sigma-70 family RNA polymerase sigma factor [Phycisphaerales bacterium]|nr:sigma-70 family RNA polymerase sigma factor [Phycisphaerales bacterium]
MPEDVELVRKIGRGDREAFRTLVKREGRYLYGIAHALTGNAADAEDAVQETFAALLNTRFRGESSLRTWLVRILVRRVGMLRRSRRRSGSHRTWEAQPAEGSETELAIPSGTASTEARLDLATMLNSLSPEHRMVLILRELHGLTYAELAAALGIPQGTVESRLHRARTDLRKRFKGYL